MRNFCTSNDLSRSPFLTWSSNLRIWSYQALLSAIIHCMVSHATTLIWYTYIPGKFQELIGETWRIITVWRFFTISITGDTTIMWFLENMVWNFITDGIFSIHSIILLSRVPVYYTALLLWSLTIAVPFANPCKTLHRCGKMNSLYLYSWRLSAHRSTLFLCMKNGIRQYTRSCYIHVCM